MAALLFETADVNLGFSVKGSAYFVDNAEGALLRIGRSGVIERVRMGIKMARQSAVGDCLWAESADDAGRVLLLDENLEAVGEALVRLTNLCGASSQHLLSWDYAEEPRLLELATGKVTAIGTECINVSLSEHSLLVLIQMDDRYRFAEYRPTGALQWSFAPEGEVQPAADYCALPSMVSDRLALLPLGKIGLRSPGELIWIDRSSGAAVRTLELESFCGLTLDGATCVVTGHDSVSRHDAETGELLATRQLPGFGECAAARLGESIVVWGRSGRIASFSSDLASELESVVLPDGFMPANWIGASDSMLRGYCVHTKRAGHRSRRSALFVRESISPVVLARPQLPELRRETENGVVRYVLRAIDGSLYDIARSTRIAVRDAFYAVGREGTLQTQSSFDAEHAGEIVIEYGGCDSATLEHLKRLAEQETQWAKPMKLHAGAGRDKLFTVSVREV